MILSLPLFLNLSFHFSDPPPLFLRLHFSRIPFLLDPLFDGSYPPIYNPFNGHPNLRLHLLLLLLPFPLILIPLPLHVPLYILCLAHEVLLNLLSLHFPSRFTRLISSHNFGYHPLFSNCFCLLNFTHCCSFRPLLLFHTLFVVHRPYKQV